MNKNFEALIKAIVDIASVEVVNLIDSKREPVADAAQRLHLEYGYHASWLDTRSPADIVGACIRENRQPKKGDIVDGKICLGVGSSFVLWGNAYRFREITADAAEFLHCDHAFTANWLRHHDVNSIDRYAEDLRTMSRDRVAMMRLFEPPVFQADSVGILMNGLLYEPNGDGWSFKLKYPDRERTADSAQYLWKNQHSGNWADTLKRYTSAEIRHIAQGRQAYICKDVADAAWIAFDEGGYRLDLKCGSVERILDLASRAKARREVRKNATIELTPAEVGSGLDRVKWAEGLIKQLPEDHEGRNSWLMNYGQKAVQAADMAERVAK